MKNLSIIFVFSILLIEGRNSWASKNVCSEEDQNKIRRLILDNIPNHTFSSSKKFYESGSSVNHKNELNLSCKDLTDEKIRGFVEKMIVDLHREEIQILNLSHNQIGDSGAISLSSALDYLVGLEELDVRENSIGLLGLQSIFIKASNLKKLFSIKYSGEEKDIFELEKLSGSKINPFQKSFIAHFNK